MQWKLFADLAEVAGDKRVTVEVESGATVTDALAALLEARPALETRVLDDDGELADHINILQNGENVFATGQGLQTHIDQDDELAMFPPVSGG
jgi:molybdopterin synthase sulfur carrier subunit